MNAHQRRLAKRALARRPKWAWTHSRSATRSWHGAAVPGGLQNLPKDVSLRFKGVDVSGERLTVTIPRVTLMEGDTHAGVTTMRGLMKMPTGNRKARRAWKRITSLFLSVDSEGGELGGTATLAPLVPFNATFDFIDKPDLPEVLKPVVERKIGMSPELGHGFAPRPEGWGTGWTRGPDLVIDPATGMPAAGTEVSLYEFPPKQKDRP